ncbi:hypothetical protein [Chryseobacterium sp.]|uniref:hypothetical protein n=1 Tax=Chryseobacterium sp. TaxID=1871047 RepID=UPI00289FDC35|nr:hypothetical protein [Chryseobacterium sp.]
METIREKKYLSDGLSEAFNNHVTRDDLSEVQKETGVSVSTLIAIRKQEQFVTERSETAVVELAKRALKNASSTEKEARRSLKSLKSFLDCI